MPLNQQIRTMQGDIEELQKKGMAAAPPKPQISEPPQGLPIEEKLAPPAPPRPTLRAEIQAPARPMTPISPAPPRPAPAPIAPPRMEIRPPAPPAKRGEPVPPRPAQPAPMPPKPPREELSAKERLFITPKPTAPALPKIERGEPVPTPPAPPKLERGEPTPPKKIEPEKPSFGPTVPPERTKWPKVLFTTVLIAALAGATGGFFYWWLVIKKPPLPPPPPPLEKPAALIPIDEDYVITLAGNEGKTKILNEINIVLETVQQQNTFKRILIKQSAPKEEYLNFPKLSDMLGLDWTSPDDYTLFSYSQIEGNKLGLILKNYTVQYSKFELLELESTFIDLVGELLGISANLTPATPDFQNNIYKEIAIRYKNLPDPDISLDYALYEPKNLLIFTTSRDSMWAVIDKLTQ